MPNLKTLKAEDAVAALNPLLFERETTTRRDAMAALQARADRSSVPYLLMAIEDPEGDIAYSASTTLHRVLKIKPLSSNRADWEAHREADAAPLYAWWRDELLGNHIGTPYWRQRRKSQAEYEKRQAQNPDASKPDASKLQLLSQSPGVDANVGVKPAATKPVLVKPKK